MNIHCIIPTRGDRSEFVNFAVRQMENQTLLPTVIDVVDYPPVSNKVDLASRFQIGIERNLADGADVVFFIEDDDFYCEEYIETMMKMWVGAGKPSLFGLDVTIYYHLDLRMAGSQTHRGRASLYSSMISKEFDMGIWPKDPDPFVDIKIWKRAKSSKAVSPIDTLCLGMKHGTGKCGGGMHDPVRFKKAFKGTLMPDNDLSYLASFTGPAFWFYRSIMEENNVSN